MIEIKKSTKHGKGLFATTDIKKNTKIGEYTGIKLKCNTKKQSHFLFEVKRNKKCLFIIDGYKNNNLLKNINHADLYSEQNTKFYQYKERIFLKSIKNIQKGTELLTWYGNNTYNI